MSQLRTIINLFTKNPEPKSIDEVEEATGFLRPNIRRILGQGEKSGTFKRISRGVYTLTSEDGKVSAYVDCGCAEVAVPKLVKKGFKFDSIFLDCAYYSKALIGGNRGINYSFISSEKFKTVVDACSKLLKTPESHVYVMLSGATTAQADMQKYVDACDSLKLVGEGTYTKTFANGKPVTNVRGKVAMPERLLLFTLSGQTTEPVNLNFRYPRPKGYQTEKAKEFIRDIITQATKVGDFVLDAFGGSGVTAEQSVLAGRSIYIIEKSIEVVTNLILPRTALAIKSYNFLNE